MEQPKKLQKNDKEYKNVILGRPYICSVNYKKYTMEEMELIHKVENGELDMLGYVMLNPELKRICRGLFCVGCIHREKASDIEL